MELTIKQLKQGGQVFVPQTTAEAVLVKDQTEVLTLDKVLDKKLENIITPAGSGLQAIKQDKNVVLIHSNSIQANDSPVPVQIKYDNRGHIIEVAPQGSLIVVVNNDEHLQYNGGNSQRLLMGDDFELDDKNNITLKWNNI